MVYSEQKGESFRPNNGIQAVKYVGGIIMLWGFIAAGGTGAIKIDGIMRK